METAKVYFTVCDGEFEFMGKITKAGDSPRELSVPARQDGESIVLDLGEMGQPAIGDGFEHVSVIYCGDRVSVMAHYADGRPMRCCDCCTCNGRRVCVYGDRGCYCGC